MISVGNQSRKRLSEFGTDGFRRLGLADYFLASFHAFTETIDFTGKKILEIGGSSLSQEFVSNVLGVDQWTSIDIISHQAGLYQYASHVNHYEQVGVNSLASMTPNPKKSYEIYDGGIDQVDYSLRAGYYDHVISINAFEHVLNLDKAIETAFHLVNNKGSLAAQYGPIWSSIKGSHFWIDSDLNFMKSGPVPPFAHLLMEPEELRYYLDRYGLDESIRDRILEQHFQSSFINRLFFEDYQDCVARSLWRISKVKGLWSWDLPGYLLRELRSRYGQRDFSSIGIYMNLQK
jgi:hypothetical protein